MTDDLKSLYVDCPSWAPEIKPDDFIVAVGKRKSNSVYHVFEVNAKPNKKRRMTRYHMKVFQSDLVTALYRESGQVLIPMTWYSRDKK